MTELPRHCNPTGQDRIACAPYTFIPLPETVVTAVDSADQLPAHDSYANPGYPHTGYIDVTLTTRSPLYVRCGLPLDALDAGGDMPPPAGEVPARDLGRDRPEFFHTGDPASPVIPGSSLRGMLRALVTIVSYGKIGAVTNKRLFFRSVDNSSLGLAYRNRMTAGERKPLVKPGFLRFSGDGAQIVPCDMRPVARDARVDGTEGGSRNLQSYLPANGTKQPSWELQHRRVWVEPLANGRAASHISLEQRNGWTEGIMVLTGAAPGGGARQRQWVFLPPDANAGPIPVDAELVRRFEDDDQLSQWQEQAFPRSKPQGDSRPRDGALQRDAYRPNDPARLGDPVFYLMEEERLTFFGRARMFRLPYNHTPRSLIPAELNRPADIDFAEAMFGYVKGKEVGTGQDDPARAYAGRVSVTSAVWQRGEQAEPWLQSEPIVPHILSSPKPTAFQHYLVQPNPGNSRGLEHYDSDGSKTTIRGFKRYWRQRDRTAAELSAPGTVAPGSTQHTRFRPVASGQRFRFRVYFESLSPSELGALCWALRPRAPADRQYCHALGMGKPLGMGSVTLDASLHLTRRTPARASRDDPPGRYERLFADDGGWHAGEVPANGEWERYVDAFEEAVLDRLSLAGECTHLWQVRRIGMLLKSMEWPGYPPRQPSGSSESELANNRQRNTRYMRIAPVNEYKARPVLPRPDAFGELTGEVDPQLHNTGSGLGEEPLAALRSWGTPASTRPDAPAIAERPPSPPLGSTPSLDEIFAATVLARRGQQVEVRLEGAGRGETLSFQPKQEQRELIPPTGQTIRVQVTKVDPVKGEVTGIKFADE